MLSLCARDTQDSRALRPDGGCAVDGDPPAGASPISFLLAAAYIRRAKYSNARACASLQTPSSPSHDTAAPRPRLLPGDDARTDLVSHPFARARDRLDCGSTTRPRTGASFKRPSWPWASEAHETSIEDRAGDGRKKPLRAPIEPPSFFSPVLPLPTSSHTDRSDGRATRCPRPSSAALLSSSSSTRASVPPRSLTPSEGRASALGVCNPAGLHGRLDRSAPRSAGSRARQGGWTKSDSPVASLNYEGRGSLFGTLSLSCMHWVRRGVRPTR